MAAEQPAMTSVKLPDTPYIVAGGLGGPLCFYLMTPARNGCTLGATNPTAGMMQLYRQVFARGFARAWTGGIYPAMYACPSFIALGPTYHAFVPHVGVPGAALLSAFLESTLLYGAETCNAQMAKNLKAPGTIAAVQPSWKPFGPGFSIHVTRNLLAVAGMRVFCTPCTAAVERLSGRSSEVTKTAGSFAGNVLSACLTAPVHQLYGFTVTTPELRTMGPAARRQQLLAFLRAQYLVQQEGRTRLSSIFLRDLTMRAMYVGTLCTMYATVERTLIQNWSSITGHLSVGLGDLPLMQPATAAA